MSHHQSDPVNLSILKYLSEGNTQRQIAEKIYLSFDAVNARLDKMRQEAGVKNNTELVFYYSDQIKLLKKAS